MERFKCALVLRGDGKCHLKSRLFLKNKMFPSVPLSLVFHLEFRQISKALLRARLHRGECKFDFSANTKIYQAVSVGAMRARRMQVTERQT